MATFDYFELAKIYFGDLAAMDAQAARQAIAEGFARLGVSAPLEEIAADQLAAAPAHFLLVWANDDDMSLNVFAVPEGALSEELYAAFMSTKDKGYAFDEIMCEGAEGTALLRIDAAMGHVDSPDHLCDYEEFDPEIAQKIPETDRECMEPYRVATIERLKEPVFVGGALSKRFTHSSCMRRSQ